MEKEPSIKVYGNILFDDFKNSLTKNVGFWGNV